jgi:hypothetical protein
MSGGLHCSSRASAGEHQQAYSLHLHVLQVKRELTGQKRAKPYKCTFCRSHVSSHLHVLQVIRDRTSAHFVGHM